MLKPSKFWLSFCSSFFFLSSCHSLLSCILAVCCGSSSFSKFSTEEKAEAAITEYYIVNTDGPFLTIKCISGAKSALQFEKYLWFAWVLRVLFHSLFPEGRTRGHMVDAERWDLSDQCVWQVSFPTGCHIPWKKRESGASVAVLKGCRWSPAPLRMLVGTGAAELSA